MVDQEDNQRQRFIARLQQAGRLDLAALRAQAPMEIDQEGPAQQRKRAREDDQVHVPNKRPRPTNRRVRNDRGR